MSIGLVSQVKEESQSAMAKLWSWGNSWSRPHSTSPSNLTHFRSKYTLVLLTELFLSLLYHPVSIIVFLIIFLYFSRDQPLEV